MTETGKVIKAKNGRATVRVDRKSACGKCGACAFKPDSPHIDITLDDGLGCTVGDEVEIEISAAAIMKISAAAYSVPLIGGLSSFLVAYLLELQEAWQLASLVGGLAIGFFVLFLIDRRYRKTNRNKPVLIKKIEKIADNA